MTFSELIKLVQADAVKYGHDFTLMTNTSPTKTTFRATIVSDDHGEIHFAGDDLDELVRLVKDETVGHENPTHPEAIVDCFWIVLQTHYLQK